MGIASITKFLIFIALGSIITVSAIALYGNVTMIWIFAILGVVITLATGIYFYRQVVSPILALKEAISQRGSKLDLTQTIEISGDGEIGEIIAAYNRLLNDICKTLQDVETTTSDLTEMTDMVDTSARRIVRNSQLQTDASVSMNKAIEQMLDGINEVTEQTQTARNNTEESMKAAEAGTSDIMSTVKGIQAISDTVEKASEKIKALRDDSNSISDMAVVIHQIAEQTNLLALNAAIEAARAGDQGRGFAVVADEVRGLAQRTANSTQEISKLVIRMQEGAKVAVESMEETENEVKKGVGNAQKAGTSIDRINTGTETAAHTVNDIYDAMQKQQSASSSISSRIEQIAQISEQNSSSSAATAKSLGSIADRSHKLLSVIDHFKFQTGEEKLKLKVADQLGDDHPAVAALHYMSKLLHERTNGRIVLTVHSGGALGNDNEVFEQLKNGRVDIMRSNPAVLNDDIPETLLLALPFLFSSTAHMHKVVDGAPGKKILDACSKAGLVGLAFYDSGARSIYANKPIRNISDIAGMKLRVMPAAMWSTVAQAMKAEPIKIGMNELISAQKMGVIDAAENNIPTFDSFKQHEVFKYFSFTEHAMVPELIVFSQKRWVTLSKEDQKIIATAARDSVPEMRRLWEKTQNEAKQRAQNAGVTFVENVDKSSFQSAMRPVHNQLVTTMPLKELLREIQAL